MNIFEENSTKDDNGTQEELVHLFSICDRRDKGYIIREELEELCSNLGIKSEESNILFNDLDADNDGRISFEDFSSGFAEFLSPEESQQGLIQVNERRRTSMWNISNELNKRPEKMFSSEETLNEPAEKYEISKELNWRRKESVYQAWTSFTSSLLDSNLLSLTYESQSQIRQLYKELQCKTIPLNVANKVECAVTSLVKEMEQLHRENKDLEKLYHREKKTHLKRLKHLEDEIEGQVSQAEERAIVKARRENDEEKRKLQDKMAKEFLEMKAHLKLYQKVESWLKNDHGPEDERFREVRNKLEVSHNSNRELENHLQEATTNVSLLRSDLAHSRLQYEEKCKELHREREQMFEYMHQYENLRRQLNLIHDANKRLQDTNDCLRENVDSELKFGNSLSRSSSMRSSMRSSSFRNLSRSNSISPPNARDQEETKYGVNRLMDDLDSGHSTLPDKAEDAHLIEHDNDQSQVREISPRISHDDCFEGGPLTQSQTIQTKFPSEPKTSTNYKTYLHCSPSSSFILHSSQAMKEESENEEVDLLMRSNSNNVMNSIETLNTPERTHKIVLAGDAAVGKTTFILRLCQGVFLTNTASTLGVDYRVKSMSVDGKHMVIQLWDTAGQERFRSITKSYFRRADGVLLLYDVTSERSFINVRQWVQNIDDACETKLPLVICGNKKDLKERYMTEGFSVVQRSAGESLANEHNATFFETSTKTGENVLNAVEELTRQMSASEDLAVQTSALRVISSGKKFRCCLTGKNF